MIASVLKRSRQSFALLDRDRILEPNIDGVHLDQILDPIFSDLAIHWFLVPENTIFGHTPADPSSLFLSYFVCTLCHFVQLFFPCSILCSDSDFFLLLFRYIGEVHNWYIYFIPGRLLGRRRIFFFFFP